MEGVILVVNNMSEFKKNSINSLKSMIDDIKNSKTVNIDEFDGKNTVLVIIDMVNGFTKEGPLKDDRIKNLIPIISDVSKKCDELKIKKIAFADSHTDESPEFDSYPEHCRKGSSEEEIVEELKQIGGYQLIKKNSTNGFHEKEFKSWLKANKNIRNYIIVGDCTDICIMQFALSLKTYYNMSNEKVRVYIPYNAVETYNVGNHFAELQNVTSLYNMMINGIEVIKITV